MIRLISVLAVLTGGVCSARPVHAHVPPEEVARACVEKVNQILDRCENAAADETEACLMLLRRYLAAGNRDAAIATARECLQHARRRTRACVAAVREVCTRCIDYLLLVGADRLAARVRNACADAIDHLERLYQRQENAIKGALGV